MVSEDHYRAEAARLFASRPPPIQKVVAVLVESRGRFDSADSVARAAGLRNRHRLNDLLMHEQMPPLWQLGLILRVLWWSIRWDEEALTLARQASDEGRYASQLSRDVLRALGTPWSKVKQHGTTWVVERIRERLPRAM